MKIYIAQINPKIADIAYNLKIIRQHIDKAYNTGARLVIFGELSLTGYALKDVFLTDTIIKQSEQAITEITSYQPDIAVIIGYPKQDERSSKLLNTAGVLYKGAIHLEYTKRALVDFGCFNESRYFTTTSDKKNTFYIENYQFALSICHDIWEDKIMKTTTDKPVDAIINISASPYEIDKNIARDIVLNKAAKYHKCSIIYANIVGAYDSLIFDGNSKFINKNGDKALQLKHCEEDSLLFDLTSSTNNLVHTEPLEELCKALVMGIRDYINDNSLSKVCIGLSGGLDSAVIATLAVDAIGKENVIGVFMPSAYTSTLSFNATEELAKNLNIKLITQPITNCFENLQFQLSNNPVNPEKIEQQNMQSRLRCCILMYYANLFDAIVLNTGNKSELAMGYCTTYGDMIGAIAPIGDLFKTQVFDLAKILNIKEKRIPEKIIQRAPSAELSPNQKDTDQLLEYAELDLIIAKIIQAKCVNELNKKELEIYNKIKKVEHKRKQAPFVLKLTNSSFNIDRQQPITYKLL